MATYFGGMIEPLFVLPEIVRTSDRASQAAKEELMTKTLHGLSALILPAGLALSLIGASYAGQETRTRRNPPRVMTQPYTEEFRNTTVWIRADGSTSTQQQEKNQLSARDSQGRRLLATTQLTNGFSGSTVDDPVAGTRTIWNSRSKQAKMLIFPTPVAGRASCWRITLADQKVERGDPQLGMFWTSCSPAGEHQLPYCTEHEKAVEPPPDNSPEAKETYTDCLKNVNSMIVPGKISEQDEDLGVKEIQGFQAQGCRVTTTAENGKHVTEYWITKIGTERRNLAPPLGSVDEFPSVAKGETIKITRELVRLTLGEPDPALFLPPKDYEIKQVPMHEVPCETASNPAVDAADPQ
jgi:hypothetical protein